MFCKNELNVVKRYDQFYQFILNFQTTLAHIIAKQCKTTENSRFVKLSATMCGVNEVKEVIKVAANDRKFKRKTILFMDEIHRFNKLQQVRLMHWSLD